MRGLVLGNKSYERHSTDEGDQLQQGLVAAGWQIAGRGYPIDSVNVPEILDKARPTHVFVQDPRDFDARSPGCYDRSVSFEQIEVLGQCPDIVVSTVVKDAGSAVAYQREMAERIGAQVIVTYYHDQSILPLSPWLAPYLRVRTYHSVDKYACLRAWHAVPRRYSGIVTGALSDVYPLRLMAVRRAQDLRIDYLPHPGYGARGSHVPRYLETIGRYRVHVATASRYGFALRKIIESVAMGTTPVTDLPSYDVLPEIDSGLVRVVPEFEALHRGIMMARTDWDAPSRSVLAAVARDWYDYRAQGRRLAAALMRATVPAG